MFKGIHSRSSRNIEAAELYVLQRLLRSISKASLIITLRTRTNKAYCCLDTFIFIAYRLLIKKYIYCL
jgi:hypothetical protein